MDKYKSVLLEVKKVLTELYGDQLKNIILYGSYARGEQKQDSDIDLAIILKGNIHSFKEIDRIIDQIYDIELKYNLLVSVHPISEKKFENEKNPFLLNVKEEGVLI
jgi:predicted nucleotidyltransferase